MKRIKKLASILLAMAMVLGMAINAASPSAASVKADNPVMSSTVVPAFAFFPTRKRIKKTFTIVIWRSSGNDQNP